MVRYLPLGVPHCAVPMYIYFAMRRALRNKKCICGANARVICHSLICSWKIKEVVAQLQSGRYDGEKEVKMRSTLEHYLLMVLKKMGIDSPDISSELSSITDQVEAWDALICTVRLLERRVAGLEEKLGAPVPRIADILKKAPPMDAVTAWEQVPTMTRIFCGAHNPMMAADHLRFHVNGDARIFVTLPSDDCYNIYLVMMHGDGSIRRSVEGIHFDRLGDAIQGLMQP